MRPPSRNRVESCFIALDQAIAVVANQSLTDLRRGLRPVDVISKVANGLRELKKLQDPNSPPPDYDDPWVGLCYILWYQPGQTFLAYLLLDQLAKKRRTSNLRLFDVGCGALAAEIALDIALTTGSFGRDRLALERVLVESQDDSQTMINLGERVSLEMLSSEEWPDATLGLVSDRALVHPSSPTYTDLADNEDRWVTAFHAVYRQSIPRLHHHLASIGKWAVPNQIALTCHKSKSDLLRQSAPFSSGDPVLVATRLAGASDVVPRMPNITDVRKQIYRFAERAKMDPPSQNDVALIKSYMGNEPSWTQSIHNSVGLFYERPKP